MRHIAYQGEERALMGETYSISGRGEGFDGKTERERPLGNTDSNGRIILKWIFNK